MRPNLAPETVAAVHQLADKAAACTSCKFYRSEEPPPVSDPPKILLQPTCPPQFLRTVSDKVSTALELGCTVNAVQNIISHACIAVTATAVATLNAVAGNDSANDILQVGSSGPPYGLLQGSLGDLAEVPPHEGGTIAKYSPILPCMTCSAASL